MPTYKSPRCAQIGPDRILERAASLPPGRTELLEIWLAENPERSALRAAVFGELCDAESRVGRYRAAADACTAKADLLGEDVSSGLAQSIAFWRTLASLPPVQVIGEFDQPLSYGWTGMAEVAVETGATRAGWGVDTGAEVSVVRASDAARFGVRLLDDDFGVSGSTAGVAVGRLGVIDTMRIGAAEIRNVPVLADQVLSDRARLRRRRMLREAKRARGIGASGGAWAQVGDAAFSASKQLFCCSRTLARQCECVHVTCRVGVADSARIL